jgi:hypothetical protein
LRSKAPVLSPSPWPAPGGDSRLEFGYTVVGPRQRPAGLTFGLTTQHFVCESVSQPAFLRCQCITGDKATTVSGRRLVFWGCLSLPRAVTWPIRQAACTSPASPAENPNAATGCHALDSANTIHCSPDNFLALWIGGCCRRLMESNLVKLVCCDRVIGRLLKIRFSATAPTKPSIGGRPLPGGRRMLAVGNRYFGFGDAALNQKRNQCRVFLLVWAVSHQRPYSSHDGRLSSGPDRPLSSISSRR